MGKIVKIFAEFSLEKQMKDNMQLIIPTIMKIGHVWPLCDPMNCSTPGFPVLHYLPEFAQTHVHWVSGAIWPSHPLLPPSPSALNLYNLKTVQEQVFSIYWICGITLVWGNVKWSHRGKKKKAKPDRSFSKFVSKVLKMYMELPIKRCKAETLLKH